MKEEAEFKTIKNGILRKLKQIHEKSFASQAVLVHNEIKTANDIEKEIIEEIKQEMTKMTDFEKNLVPCLIEELNTLKSFEYPNDYHDIRREYRWITSEFEEYLQKLEALRDLDNLPPESETIRPLSPEELEEESVSVIGLRFCSENIPKEQKEEIEDNKIIPCKSPNYSEPMNRIFLVDDDLVESFISIFCRSESKMKAILKQVCKQALFQAKVVDFCLFFLHCPGYALEQEGFLYSYISTIKKTEPGYDAYTKIASNLLDFLDNYFEENHDLIYQPRTFLENHGLKSLHAFKNKANYLAETAGLVSWFDLFIGLLGVAKITTNLQLSTKVEETIHKLLSKSIQLNVIEVKENEELPEVTRVITRKSLEKLVRSKNMDDFMRDIILHNPKLAIKSIDQKVETLISPLEELIPKLKKKKTDGESFEYCDLDEITEFEADFVSFEKLLGAYSSMLSVPLLKTIKPLKRKQVLLIDSAQEKEALKEIAYLIKENLLNMKVFEDFMILLFEVANYGTDNNLKNETIIFTIVKTCIHFYALICIAAYQAQNPAYQARKISTEVEFPILSRFSSFESTHDIDRLPEFTMTFSQLKRSREFNFDVLFMDLCRKYQERISDFISDNCCEDDKFENVRELFIICKKLPCAVEFSLKKTLLK